MVLFQLFVGAYESVQNFFSLTNVSQKFANVWLSAREKVYGEDYWIPSDFAEVAYFPPERLHLHRTIYPPPSQPVVNVVAKVSLTLLQGIYKRPDAVLLHHVVYSFNNNGRRQHLSIFRSTDPVEAMDFLRRCEECRVLFRLLDKRKDIRRGIREISRQFEAHPLWRMVHIAIACGRKDIFTDEGLTHLIKFGYSIDDIIKIAAPPEGETPLMLAIQTNQIEIVKFLLKIGADPLTRDVNGNTALHYAALVSVQLVEALWECEGIGAILNSLNNDRYTPIVLAIRNANPRILKLLLSYGAELTLLSSDKNPLFEALQSKGKAIEYDTSVIRTLLNVKPELLHSTDESGNTPLHMALHKIPLMSLLSLKAKEMNLNVKNSAGQTPLHLFTVRNDIGLIVTLVSYNCELNTPDANGNTALHMAVSKNLLELTRLLLCLGADPNLLNVNGDSPRHLAAKLHETNLLTSLIICDAKRCPETKSGCGSGCANKILVRQLKRSAENRPHIYSPIEDLEKRTFVKRLPYRYNRILDAEHNTIYDEMLKKLTEMAEKKEKNANIINVLSLDGGGIRGLVIAQVLLEVEKLLGEPLFKYIDWIGGTSTGAIIGAGLSIGLTIREIQRVYLRFKDCIFEGWARPYNSLLLEKFIQSELGNDTLLSDIKWPRLMFAVTRADCFPIQLELMRNYRLPISDEENLQMGFSDPKELLLWKALRRTSSAPTYFSCVDNKYIDGGIISNNPTQDLMAEIQLWNSVNKFLKKDKDVKIGCIISLGTGVIPTIPMDPVTLDYSIYNPMNFPAIKNLGILLIDQVTATEGVPVSRSSSWCLSQNIPYFRLSPPLFKEIPLDTRDDLDLARMMWDCMEYTHIHREYIEKMCVLIKRIGESTNRQNLYAPEGGPTTTTTADVHQTTKNIEKGIETPLK